MRNSEFQERLNSLSEEDRLVLEEEIGKENLSSVKRFGEALKSKLQQIGKKPKQTLTKVLGALLISSMIIGGASGCADTPVTETPKTTVSSKAPENSTYATSSYTTTEGKPNESTSAITVESTPVTSTDKTPDSSETPPVTSTPDSSTTPPTTSEPESSEVPPISTAPDTGQDKPVEDNPVIDIPGDEDGYTYPEFFANLIHKDIVLNHAISEAVEDHREVYNDLPEIVFITAGESTLENPSPIEVYAKFDLNDGGELYSRFIYRINGLDYMNIMAKKKYSNYDQYVEAVVTALQNQDKLFSAEYGEEEIPVLDEDQSEAFAQLIDPNFVDVDVFYFKRMNDSTNGVYRDIAGFAFDAEGKVYSFSIETKYPMGYPTIDKMADGLLNGEIKIQDFEKISSNVKRIDSVFVSETQSESEAK